jgi:hypothetical protein
MADEATVKQWETFLASSPLGVSYSGQTGQVTPALQTAINQLALKLQQTLGRPVNLTVYDPASAQKLFQEAQQAKQKPEAPGQKPAQPAQKTSQGELIKAWRAYLKVGDANNPQPDQQLIQAITAAEGKISSVVPSAKGIIWQGNQINPQVPPSEYDTALKLLQQAKPADKPVEQPKTAVAMPTLDALGPPPGRDEQPSATKFVLSDEDTKIETGDPMETQMNGVMVNKLPKRPRRRRRRRCKGRRPTMDDRLLRLVDLMADMKK